MKFQRSVNIEDYHGKFLESHPEINLSEKVREMLDKMIAELKK